MNDNVIRFLKNIFAYIIIPLKNNVFFFSIKMFKFQSGRISMLAVLGHLVTTAGVRLPGNIAKDLPFASMKTGISIL